MANSVACEERYAAGAKLERFQALFGWANRLLRIDLSNAPSPPSRCPGGA